MRNKKQISFAKTINMQVYPFQLMISVGQNDDELGAELDKHKDLNEESIRACQYPSKYSPGKAVLTNTNLGVIRLRELPRLSSDYGVLAHEIFHMVTFVLERAGLKMVVDVSCEAYAYLIGYLTEKIFDAMNEYY